MVLLKPHPHRPNEADLKMIFNYFFSYIVMIIGAIKKYLKTGALKQWFPTMGSKPLLRGTTKTTGGV